MGLLRNASLILALASLPGMAQTPEFGAHGGLNLPIGDLNDAVDGRLGLTVGGHAAWYYGEGHELRTRFDLTHYAGGWQPGPGGHFSKNTVQAWGLAADYLHYTEQTPRGFYLTLGLGYQWWTVDPNNGPSTSENGLAFAGGAGWRFNRTFALEGRFTTAQFRSQEGQGTALQVLASLRF